MRRPVEDKALRPVVVAYRCPDCGRLLFKSDAPSGTVQTLCRECRSLKWVEVKSGGGATTTA